MLKSKVIKCNLREDNLDSLIKLVSNIKYFKITGERNIANETLKFLEKIILSEPISRLCSALCEVWKCLLAFLPQQFVASNIVRRAIEIIRALQNGSQNYERRNLKRLVEATHSNARFDEYNNIDIGLINDSFMELRTEVESSYISILSFMSNKLIQTEETILVYGSSHLVEEFLTSEGIKKSRLIIVEGIDRKQSHAMANRLSSCITVLVINNASVFSVMSRVNKVLLDVKAVLANGAVLVEVGTEGVLSIAKFHSISVIALVPLYKFTPNHSHNYCQFKAAINYGIPYESFLSCTVDTFTPIWDVVPSDHISLIVTNVGCFSPSYIYTLLLDLYGHSNFE